MSKEYYTKEEILKHIDYWRNILVEGAWASKKIGYDKHKCEGNDGSDIAFTKRDFEALTLELKQKFMSDKEFKKLANEEGLGDFKFPEFK